MSNDEKTQSRYKNFAKKASNFFTSRDTKGKKYKALDRQDNGNRYRWLMLKRVFIATILIAAPWYEFSSALHTQKNTIPGIHASNSATPVKLVSFSQFFKEADAGQVKSATVIADGEWQLVIGADANGNRTQALAPYNQDIAKRLLNDHVDVKFAPPESIVKHSFFQNRIFLQIGNTLLIVLVEVGAMALMFVLFNRFMSRGKIKFIKPNKNLSLNDVAGIDDIRSDLEELVDYAKNGDHYRYNNAETPRGWLFVGPPGTGKTLTAEAIAAEAKVPYIKISGSFFVEMYVGLGARRVRDLRSSALKEAKRTGRPVIIFIDEVDAVATARGAQNSHSEKDQTLNELLTAANGQSEAEPIIWIAATNRAEILDPAFLRRFSERIAFSNPDISQREQLLLIALKKRGVRLEKENVRTIASSTSGFSGDALAKLVNAACIEAARRKSKTVSKEDFLRAMDKKIMGIPRSQRLGRMLDEEKLRTAQHEAGHALVATMLEHCHPVYKATIVPHGIAQGEALGMVVSKPDRDILSYTQEMMMSDLTKIMAGHAGEYIGNGKNTAKVSSGPSGDIIQATRLSYEMASTYGMGKSGFISLASIRNPSQNLLENMEQDSQEFVKKAHREAVHIIESNKSAWEAITRALLEKETLSGEEIVSIIQNNPEQKDILS